MTDELLGGHGQIVSDLRHRLDALCGGDTELARVVVLRGASGCGKTRIVRELFERLREAGGEPAYWPALSGVDRVTAGGADPMAARKETCPRPDMWPAGALPTFGWWGFNCERLANNTFLDVVAAARPQLDAHFTPLLMAWRDEAGLLDKAKAQRSKILAAVRDATLDEGSGAVLDLLETLNIAVPFARTLLNWGWKGAKAVRRRGQELEAMRVDTDLGRETQTKKRSAGEDLADIIRSVSHPHLPAVVVIEDMHLMGAELDALVDRLSEPAAGSPVLVIGTAWPEGFDNPPYADWITRAKTRGAVQVVDVPTLDDSDLITILRWHAPATTSESATRVVQQLNNPHFLKLWLTVDATRRHIHLHNGAIVLDSEDPIHLPPDIEAVLLLRWRELPDLTRKSLLDAMAVNPLDDVLAPFVPELVADIATAFDETKERGQVLGGLASAVDCSWCRLEAPAVAHVLGPFALDDQARAAPQAVLPGPVDPVEYEAILTASVTQAA